MYDRNKNFALVVKYQNRLEEQEKLIDAIRGQVKELEEALEYRDAIIEALVAALEIAQDM